MFRSFWGIDVKKILVAVLFSFILIVSISRVVSAASAVAYDEKIYEEQYNNSGADKLFNELPGEVKKSFDSIGINKPDFNQIMDINPESILKNILDTTKKKLPGALKSVSMILAVILLNAIFSAFKISLGEKSIATVLALISNVCICMIIISPIVCFVERSASIVKASSAFLLCYIPIMFGIMLVSGQAFSSAAFSSIMLTLSNIITQLSTNFLVPALNIFFALSIVCSISTRFNFAGVCELFAKIIKWFLGFIMAIFSGLLTTKSLIGVAVDSANSKTMKFVLSSFVPIVGSALGDAFLTVQGCIKILKSGVGAFFIIATGFIFLPVIIECVIWLLATNICMATSDIFELANISMLLKNIGKVVSIIMAVILCIMTVLIVSTVVVLNIGGGAI